MFAAGNTERFLLTYTIQMPTAVDEYLMWTISDGGDACGTDMPVLKDALTDRDGDGS